MEDYRKENRYLRAKERVEEIRKFYNNLTSYLVIITILAVVNYWDNEWRYAWFLWVVFGWGIGITFHAFRAFNWSPFFGRDWEERKIKEFMQDEERRDRWE